jgi:hypothetical protein
VHHRRLARMEVSVHLRLLEMRTVRARNRLLETSAWRVGYLVVCRGSNIMLVAVSN